MFSLYASNTYQSMSMKSLKKSLQLILNKEKKFGSCSPLFISFGGVIRVQMWKVSPLRNPVEPP